MGWTRAVILGLALLAGCSRGDAGPAPAAPPARGEKAFGAELMQPPRSPGSVGGGRAN